MLKITILYTLCSILLLGISCPRPKMLKNDEIYLNKIQLPEGFKIDLYAEGVANARSMTMGDNGTLFVSTRGKGNVYAILDENQDYQADKIITLAEDLNMPNGVAFHEGALYVAEVDKIWRYDNIEANLDNPPKPTLISDAFPSDRHHGWKFIAFGPDNKLYVPVGAPCNICESEEIYASITRMNPDGSDLEVFAHGVRNSVGFDWHPETQELWFTDNGRDMLGDDIPPCELNHAPKANMHFGYPYCHGGDISDPKFGDKRACEEFTQPAQNLGPHVAPLGFRFYTGDMFPPEYKNKILIAEHGSWNRSNKIGYRVTAVTLDENHQAIAYEDFATGWLNDESAWGRPVDILYLADGSMLLSDDYADAIYRISYEKK